MSIVYFIENSGIDYAELGKDALELFKKLESDTKQSLVKEMPIKVHFGEKGNITYMPPTCYDAIINYLQEKGISPFFIETSVLYRGARTRAKDHIRIAREHGFTQIPIVIADGEWGTEYNEIEINKEYIDRCKIGAAYGNYRELIVMSHFKGHISAGFGGAIKQLAMGFASRGGKLAQHSGLSPIVESEKCIACGLCVEKCDFDAICLEDYAIIDKDKCVGCAGCIAVCPEGAIRNNWDRSKLREKLAEYAYGASKGKDITYITFVHNITKECDCLGRPMELIADNIGVLASKDPVALDCACLDMVQENTGKKLFEEGRIALEHGEKIGLGSRNYQIVEIPKV
ncbi:MAG TPA: DUF362 domain-containing protein [Eubacteriaceae bacterium]|nr:DUF362 domain-containing protein [Eubacteriaceae bacterium]